MWLDQWVCDVHADGHWWMPLAGLVHHERAASWLPQIAKHSVHLKLHISKTGLDHIVFAQ